MKPWYWIILLIVVVLVVTFFTGPKIPKPTYATELPEVPSDLHDLAAFVDAREAEAPTREDNQARIRFYEDSVARTEYAIVYLHGFAGSYRDGYPLNVRVADSLRANSYLARYAGHGLRPPASLDDFTPETAWDFAREALAIGRQLGDKVIVMSTSTGGTLALKLAAEFPDAVYALVNLSPNVKDDVPGAWLLNSPWGHELARLASFGSHRRIEHEEPAAERYWDTIFPAAALVNLQVLVSTTMTEETYRKVRRPVLTLYYYKNWRREDERVEVDVYPEVHAALATPEGEKRLVQLPNPGTHFIGSDIKSKDYLGAEREILAFLNSLRG